MYDRSTLQSEVDYRRERLSRGRSVRRAKDRTRIPFVGDQATNDRRMR